MRKLIFFFVFAASCVCASAQHASPLPVMTSVFCLDSLRAEYASNPTALVSALMTIQHRQAADEQLLAEAARVLKDERAFGKQLVVYLKTAEQFLGEMNRAYDMQSKAIESHKELISTQGYNLAKAPFLPVDTRDGYIALLHGDRSNMDAMLDRLDECHNYCTREASNLRAIAAGLSAFELELQNKGIELERLNAELKANKEVVKDAIKAAKAAARGK